MSASQEMGHSSPETEQWASPLFLSRAVWGGAWEAAAFGLLWVGGGPVVLSIADSCISPQTFPLCITAHEAPRTILPRVPFSLSGHRQLEGRSCVKPGRWKRKRSHAWVVAVGEASKVQLLSVGAPGQFLWPPRLTLIAFSSCEKPPVLH